MYYGGQGFVPRQDSSLLSFQRPPHAYPRMLPPQQQSMLEGRGMFAGGAPMPTYGMMAPELHNPNRPLQAMNDLYHNNHSNPHMMDSSSINSWVQHPYSRPPQGLAHPNMAPQQHTNFVTPGFRGPPQGVQSHQQYPGQAMMFNPNRQLGHPSASNNYSTQRRVLRLTLPERTLPSSSPSSSIPLPHDCEGLIFAMEGKFNCGDDMVCDASSRVLEALNERSERILNYSSSTEGVTGSSSGSRTCNRNRSQKLKMLESSWITSTYLAKMVCRIVRNKLLPQILKNIEPVAGGGGVDPDQHPIHPDQQPLHPDQQPLHPDQQPLHPDQQPLHHDQQPLHLSGDCSVKEGLIQENSQRYLDILEFNIKKVEALTINIQILEKWANLRYSLGLLFKEKANRSPKSANNSCKSPSKTSKKISFDRTSFLSLSEQSPLIEEPVKRKRGRPPGSGAARYLGNSAGRRDGLSMGEFVDSLKGVSEFLVLPQPILKPGNAFDDLEQTVLSLCDIWVTGFVHAENLLKMRRETNRESDMTDDSHPNATLTPLIDAHGNSALLHNIDQEVFDDQEITNLFSESVKEAEFILWREKRRQSVQSNSEPRNSYEPPTESSNNSAGTSNSKVRGMSIATDKTPGPANDSTSSDLNALIGLVEDGKNLHREKYLAQIHKMKTEDLTVKYPVLILLNQLMHSLSKLSIVLALQNIDSSDQSVAKSLINTCDKLWIQIVPAASDGRLIENRVKCPQICQHLGTNLLTSVLDIARSLALHQCLQGRKLFSNMTYNLALFSIISFSRFISRIFFPSVAPGISKLLERMILPKVGLTSNADQSKCRLIPVELNVAQSSLLVLFSGLDELKSLEKLSEFTCIGVETYLYALLYCAFGGAVVAGRLLGLVSDADLLGCQDNGVSKSKEKSDNLTVKVLVSHLSGSLRHCVASLMKQKRPNLELDVSEDNVNQTLLISNTADKVSERTPHFQGSSDGGAFNTAAKISLGSYTQPWGRDENLGIDASGALPSTQEMHSGGTCIRTQREKLVVDGQFSRVSASYEDLVFACGSLFVQILENGTTEGKAVIFRFMSHHLPTFQEIAVLSRSSQIARIVCMIERKKNGFEDKLSFYEDEWEDPAQLWPEDLVTSSTTGASSSRRTTVEGDNNSNPTIRAF